MRMHLIYAAIALLCAAAIGMYYLVVVPEPTPLHANAKFRDSVSGISDPEHLKKVVATVARESDEFAVAAKKTVDAAVVLLVMALVLTAIAFVHAYFRLRRLERSTQRAGDAL